MLSSKKFLRTSFSNFCSSQSNSQLFLSRNHSTCKCYRRTDPGMCSVEVLIPDFSRVGWLNVLQNWGLIQEDMVLGWVVFLEKIFLVPEFAGFQCFANSLQCVLRPWERSENDFRVLYGLHKTWAVGTKKAYAVHARIFCWCNLNFLLKHLNWKPFTTESSIWRNL